MKEEGTMKFRRNLTTILALAVAMTLITGTALCAKTIKIRYAHAYKNNGSA